MSDIEQLTAENDALKSEVEKLKAKNAELLSEKKKVSGISSEAQAKIEALEEEKSDLEQQLRKFTFEDPVDQVFKEVCPASQSFRRAFEEYFSIGQDEEGRFIIQDKDGNPVTKEQKVGKYGSEQVVRELTSRELISLVWEIENDELFFFIPKPSGGGAPGSLGGIPGKASAPKPSDEKPKPTKGPSFGMR